MDLGLEGRKALVTGASQGIGRAAAHNLASEGCDLILVARSPAGLEDVRTAILAEHDVRVSTLACDIAAPHGPEHVLAAHPDIDILVNNAGAIPHGSLDEVDDARWRASWDLKVFGTIGLVRGYYPLMAARGSGVILNVMGASADRPAVPTIAIAMANAALNALTRALGGASPQDGVRVLGINPGPVATARGVEIMRRQAATILGDAERWDELTRSLPFGRLADPGEVASVIAFLVSDRDSYVTGAILNVDGGIASRAA